MVEPELPVELLESEVGLAALLQALCQLAPRHRLLLLGSLWGQLTLDELALLLKMRRQTAAGQLGRAKMELRRALAGADGSGVVP